MLAIRGSAMVRRTREFCLSFQRPMRRKKGLSDICGNKMYARYQDTVFFLLSVSNPTFTQLQVLRLFRACRHAFRVNLSCELPSSPAALQPDQHFLVESMQRRCRSQQAITMGSFVDPWLGAVVATMVERNKIAQKNVLPFAAHY